MAAASSPSATAAARSTSTGSSALAASSPLVRRASPVASSEASAPAGAVPDGPAAPSLTSTAPGVPGVRLRIIGDYRALDPSLVDLIEGAMARTAGNSGPIIAIALNYGAQDEMVRAVRAIAERAAQGMLATQDIGVEMIDAELYTADLPPLDLMIRTSGEQRLSNFLLWQAAYAELYFTDMLWPDFDGRALAAALDAFRMRDRRFGGL